MRSELAHLQALHGGHTFGRRGKTNMKSVVSHADERGSGQVV